MKNGGAAGDKKSVELRVENGILLKQGFGGSKIVEGGLLAKQELICTFPTTLLQQFSSVTTEEDSLSSVDPQLFLRSSSTAGSCFDSEGRGRRLAEE